MAKKRARKHSQATNGAGIVALVLNHWPKTTPPKGFRRSVFLGGQIGMDAIVACVFPHAVGLERLVQDRLSPTPLSGGSSLAVSDG